jgi:hypothetical protein
LLRGLRAAESIGWPLGNDRFLAGIERLTGRSLKPGKRGPKPSTPQGRRSWHELDLQRCPQFGRYHG